MDLNEAYTQDTTTGGGYFGDQEFPDEANGGFFMEASGSPGYLDDEALEKNTNDFFQDITPTPIPGDESAGDPDAGDPDAGPLDPSATPFALPFPAPDKVPPPWIDVFDTEKLLRGGLVSSKDIIDAQELRLKKLRQGVDPDVDEEGFEEDEYDGPPRTGKELGDLMESVGLPPSVGTMFDDMQDAIMGIASDLSGNNAERTSLGDILTHDNRLRGLGALLVLVAATGLAVGFVNVPS